MVLICYLPILPEEETFNCELPLDSGSSIPYVAPQKFSQILSKNEENVGGCETSQWMSSPRRKLSTAKGADGIVDMERWEGIMDFCQALDNAVEIEQEKEMFIGKRVLEFGFATGLPSAFAHRNSAKSISIHCWDESQLNNCVLPTLHQNNIPRNICKFSCGDGEEFIRTMRNQKFDIVLAPELLFTEETDFEQLHELLDALVTQNGIILISTRPYYSQCSGNLPAFLDLLKMKGQFDAHIRWISARESDIAPRKLLQMTRTIR